MTRRTYIIETRSDFITVSNCESQAAAIRVFRHFHGLEVIVSIRAEKGSRL